jgi:hypothetical protein
MIGPEGFLMWSCIGQGGFFRRETFHFIPLSFTSPFKIFLSFKKWTAGRTAPPIAPESHFTGVQTDWNAQIMNRSIF